MGCTGGCTKRVMVIALTFALFLFLGLPGYANTTHSAGESYHKATGLVCQSCHTMHNTDGSGNVIAGGPRNKLLKASGSDVCLKCHSQWGTQTGADFNNAPKVYFGTAGPGANTNPSGNFRWVSSVASANTEDGHFLSGVGGAETNTETMAAVNNAAGPPGNTGSPANKSQDLTCYTCHDPHGVSNMHRNMRVGNYNWGGTAATSTVAYPAATTLTTAESAFAGTGATRTVNDTAADHNGYQGPTGSVSSGFGYWCGSCHGKATAGDKGASNGFHSTGANTTTTEDPWLKHPTGKYLPSNGAGGSGGSSNYATNYGNYNKDIPLEDVSNTTAWAAAVGQTSQVFCLSCHQAHAGKYANAGRWDFTITSGAGTYCNKCHAQGG